MTEEDQPLRESRQAAGQETDATASPVAIEGVYLEGEEEGSAWSPVTRVCTVLGFGLFLVCLVCTPTMGATRSAHLEWRQHMTEIEEVIAGEDARGVHVLQEEGQHQ